VIRVDTALFAAAQAGDPVALDRMLRELQPDVRRYARRQCHRTTAIEDVVQEALIVLYRPPGQCARPSGHSGLDIPRGHPAVHASRAGADTGRGRTDAAARG
jgi:RNA polymerase sigma-70 factor (ECF subfamily)